MPDIHDRSLTLTLTEQQARCISEALDLYSRIGIGQMGEIGRLARHGFLRAVGPGGFGSEALSSEQVDAIRRACDAMSGALGLAPGASLGIGHPDGVRPVVKRAYELRKQIDRFLAMRRNPAPDFMDVTYDGRMLRLTDDDDIRIADATEAGDTATPAGRSEVRRARRERG